VENDLLNYITCSHEAFARMKEKKTGHIINVGSMSADIKKDVQLHFTATKQAYSLGRITRAICWFCPNLLSSPVWDLVTAG
jgi:NADP-dependent 3-hydroxy acid dehydrogenase YdfG